MVEKVAAKAPALATWKSSQSMTECILKQFGTEACSKRPPSGNLVDGLPLVAHLHAKFYLYECNVVPSGVSVVALSVEDTPADP